MEVDLHDFNIVIGANASGKTNFISIFGFLRDISYYGLENSLSMYGASDYFPNVNIGKREPSSFQIKTTYPMRPRAFRYKEGLLRIRPYLNSYSFEIKFKQRGSGYDILNDTFVQNCRATIRIGDDRKNEETGDVTFILTKEGRQITIGIVTSRGFKIDHRWLLRQYLRLPYEEGEEKVMEREIRYTYVEYYARAKTLILEIPFAYTLIREFSRNLDELSIYSLAPELSKMAVPIKGKVELEEDGRNLAIVLKDILKDREKKRKFTNFLKDLLPFVDDLSIERFADKSLLMTLRETYGKSYFPASILSEGTINTAALIVCLFFEEKLLKIIEEPERSIHPQIISKLVDMMKESSRKTQLIITTHNPQFIKHADMDDILLISRNEQGYSVISRPAKTKMLKSFLKKDLGIDDLYVQNILELIVNK
jgi:predicted ATPase